MKPKLMYQEVGGLGNSAGWSWVKWGWGFRRATCHPCCCPHPQLKVPAEEPANELPMNEIEAWKAAEKVGALRHPRPVSGTGWAAPSGWLTTSSSPQKARWVLLVLILAVVGFGALMTQLFLWEYGDLHLFGPNQRPAPCYDPCE